MPNFVCLLNHFSVQYNLKYAVRKFNGHDFIILMYPNLWSLCDLPHELISKPGVNICWTDKKSSFVPCLGTLSKVAHVFFMRHESCHVYIIGAFTFYYDININAVGNRKEWGGSFPYFQIGLLQFSYTKIRGVCEFDDGSRGHCLQYTYMYVHD